MSYYIEGQWYVQDLDQNMNSQMCENDTPYFILMGKLPW